MKNVIKSCVYGNTLSHVHSLAGASASFTRACEQPLNKIYEIPHLGIWIGGARDNTTIWWNSTKKIKINKLIEIGNHPHWYNRRVYRVWFTRSRAKRLSIGTRWTEWKFFFHWKILATTYSIYLTLYKCENCLVISAGFATALLSTVQKILFQTFNTKISFTHLCAYGWWRQCDVNNGIFPRNGKD